MLNKISKNEKKKNYKSKEEIMAKAAGRLNNHSDQHHGY
jgi:hypothetical protein